MNAVSLPDEVFFALSRFLGLNVGASTTTAQPCEQELRPRVYPISDDDSVDDPCSSSFPSYPMRRNFPEDAHYRSTPNGPTGRQNAPPPSCSQNKDYPDYNSPECTNGPLFHQEEPPVFVRQGQGLLPQIMPQNRFYQQQTHLNRSQQCPHSSPRSQSLPRANASDRYNHSDGFEGHRGLHTEQESLSPQRGRCELRTPCEGESPVGNTCLPNCNDRYISERSSRNNACGWNNSSQVGSNYCEWHRRQMQMQQQQQQHQQQQHQQQQHQQQQPCQSRQQQAHQTNMTWLEDDEISGFEPDLNSTMIDEGKGGQPLTKTCQQQMQRQYSAGNKTCNSQSQSQRMCRTPEEMPRRQTQCETPQMPRRQPQCESPPMQRRKSQQYETLINETSYMQLPEAPRNAKCRPSFSHNQCPNSQAMYQDISPMNQTKPCQQSQRSRSLSPINCSTFRNQSENQPACETNSPMDMDRTEDRTYPEDTNCSKSPTYMEMPRSILGRSYQNDTLGGRSTRTHAKTPEELLADRTQAEFVDALVKDRSCPGVIQASLNGTDNFNEFAFDIAFAGSIPAKPFPVDPISMLEAIKLRIDYERGEIRKRVRDHERDQPKDKQHRPLSTEDIESYFKESNQSEVNEGVAAYLMAESEYRVADMQTDDGFVAQINSLDTNMFDERIKLNVYSAATRPAHQ